MSPSICKKQADLENKRSHYTEKAAEKNQIQNREFNWKLKVFLPLSTCKCKSLKIKHNTEKAAFTCKCKSLEKIAQYKYSSPVCHIKKWNRKQKYHDKEWTKLYLSSSWQRQELAKYKMI